MKQINTSGATLHVPSLGREVGPGEEVTELDELLPGFTDADAADEPVDDSQSNTEVDAAEEPKASRRRAKPEQDEPSPEG